MTRGRLRLLVAVGLTLAVVGPLGWAWWSSLLPSSYSAMDMGELDFGGGPRTTAHAVGHGPGHGGAASLVDLDPTPDRPADVEVDLVARQGTVTLASGEEVPGYTLNGSSPGPLVEAEVGQLVEVRVRNEDVAGGIALHWHGLDVPNAQDGVAGVTQDAVMPGTSHTYRWVAPDVGTYWYHSHQLSHEQVTGGLLGPLVVHPRGGGRDGVQDVLALSHLYAGTPTVNGVAGVDRVQAEPGSRVRVRVVNTDNGPTAVWASAAYRLVAVDGVDVHRPGVVEDRAVGLPAGGRADLELTVPTDGSALRVSLGGGVGVEVGPEDARAPDPAQPEERVDLLSYGEPADLGLDPDRADRRFEYSIGRRPGFLDGRPGLWWSVNGALVPRMPMFVVREGDVVRLRIENHSGQVHPMHLHGHHAVVLSRDGEPATGSPWWFDSLDVRDGESVEVAFRADNPGIWMDHCHNLKHAREGLVTHLMYDGVTTPFRLGEDSGNVPE